MCTGDSLLCIQGSLTYQQGLHTLRICEPWHGTGRILVADSAFASVTTAIECKKCGLFFTGILKTASREYPKEYLSDPSRYNSRGDHISLATIVDDCSLIALGWKDKTIKTFISSCGTTLPGEPHVKYRYTKDGDLATSEVQRPQLVSQYFSAACKIDVHNHLRQGLLSIEEAWITQTWWHKLAATFFGIIVTDALLAFNYEHSTSPMTIYDFANDLASSLIFNHFDGHIPEHSQRRCQSSESIPETSSHPVDPFISHPLRSLVLLPAYQSKKGSKEGARSQMFCLCCSREKAQCTLLL